jgi:hypothetical protein
MTKRLFLTILTVAGAMTAQEATAPAKDARPPNIAVHLVHLKYADSGSIRSLFEQSGVSIQRDGALNSVVLRGDSKTVEEVERLIKELDIPESARPATRPQPNLELQVYVIAAGDEVNGDQPLPKVLDPALTQLRSLFPFRGYRLLETIEGRVGANGILASSGTLAHLESGPAPHQANYQLSITTGPIASSNDPVDLRFKFEAHASRPAVTISGVSIPERRIDSGMETRFTVNPGQLVVVGKSGYGDASLFLILSAKVAN